MNDPLAKYRKNSNQDNGQVVTDPLAKFKTNNSLINKYGSQNNNSLYGKTFDNTESKNLYGKTFDDTPSFLKPQPIRDSQTYGHIKNIGINEPGIAARNTAPINNTKPIVPTIQQPTINTNNKAPLTTVSNKGGKITFGPQFDKVSSVAGSATAGLLDSLSLGLISKGMDKLQPGITAQAQQQNPTAFTLGKIGGYLAPGALGTKLAKPLLKGVTNPLANRLLEGAIVGTGLSGIEDKVNGKSWDETGKDALTNAALGGALDLGLYGVGKGISKLLPNKVPTIEPTLQPIEQPVKEVAVTKPTLQGKFTVKNTALDKAQQNYNNAMETIQNHFMTNKLIPEEVARIKPELGIDLNKLTDSLSNAKTDVRKIGDMQRLKRVADVEHTAFDQNGKPYTTPYVQGKPLPPLRPLQKPLFPSVEPLKPQSNVNIPLVQNKGLQANLNPSIGATDRTHSISQIVSSEDNKLNKKPLDILKNGYTRIVDTNFPIKAVDNNTYIKATNAKNVGGIVDHILQNNLVNRQGKPIGESLQSIVKDIPKSEQNDFLNYVLQRHNIDRARIETKQVPKIDSQGFLVKDKNGKQVFNTVTTKESKPVYADFTSEQSVKAAKLIEQQHPEYKALNDRLVKFVNTFENEWGKNSGLINNDLWQNLQDTYKNYVPTNRSFDELEQGMNKTNGRGFVDQSTPLSKATGSDRDIINPLENIANLVNKTVRTSKYNEVGQSLVDAIQRDPAKLSKYAEIIPKGEPINSNVKNVVSVLAKGEPVNLRINDNSLLGSLNQINKNNIGPFQAYGKMITNPYKQLITQKNPVFAVRNLFRDLPTAYINGSEHNPITFAKNWGSAAKDLATNSETAQQYHALGGGGSNFFNSNKPAKSIKELSNEPNIFKKGLNAIEKGNNIIESAPRLAEFKKVLKDTGNLDKALYAANDITTNFSRGGDLTKTIDSYLPFANASVQGLDKLGRQFKAHPIATTVKGLTSVTTPAIAFDMLNKNNPRYQELDNRTKDAYYLIPNGDTFIKIPKSREIGVLFGSLAERTLRAVNGEQNSFKGFGNTFATNMAPANPIENNIFTPIITNLPKNKDFANRTIVPQSMQDRSPQYQYDEKTSEIAKKIGEITKLSPKQVDYVIKSYTGVIGQIGLPATTKANFNNNPNIFSTLVKPVTTQFTADPLYSNQAISDFYDNFDKTKASAADKNFTQNIPSKTVTPEEKIKNGYNTVSQALSALSKQAQTASQNGDDNKVKALRAKMIQLAKDANSNKFINSSQLNSIKKAK